jgi:tetratricopeptide (TPR) repeat protein
MKNNKRIGLFIFSPALCFAFLLALLTFSCKPKDAAAPPEETQAESDADVSPAQDKGLRQELLGETLYFGRPYDNTIYNNPALDSQEYYFKAREYYGRGDYANALENYERALSMSSWGAYYYHYGLCLMDMGEHEDAEKAFKKAIRYTSYDYPYDIWEPYCDARGRNLVYSFDSNGIVSELYFSYYNLACIYSLADRLEDSFNYIILAIEYGYPYLNHIFSDADLANLFSSTDSEQIRNDINRIYSLGAINNVGGKSFYYRPSPNDLVEYEFLDNTQMKKYGLTSSDSDHQFYGTYTVTNHHVIISYHRITGGKGIGSPIEGTGVSEFYRQYEDYDRTADEMEYISLKKMEVDGQHGWGWEEK